MKNHLFFFLLILALAACTPAETEDTEMAAGEYGTEEDLSQSLMEADRAWSETVGDAEAFASYIAEDGYFLPANGPRLQGRTSIQSSLDQLFQMPGLELRWQADVAEVAESGDLGYTMGSFLETVEGPEGETVSREGKYVTVWEKQQDGSWKVVADIFNYDAPPSGEGESAQ